MPFDPPSSPPPTVGQSYEYEGRRYEFDGVIWRSKTNGLENFWWPIALSSRTSPLLITNGERLTVRRTFILTSLPYYECEAAPTGSSAIFIISNDVNWAYQTGSLPSIGIGQLNSSLTPGVLDPVPADIQFNDGEFLNIEIDQVDAGQTLRGLKVHLFGRFLS